MVRKIEGIESYFDVHDFFIVCEVSHATGNRR
jgi:hypothetical protein